MPSRFGRLFKFKKRSSGSLAAPVAPHNEPPDSPNRQAPRTVTNPASNLTSSAPSTNPQPPVIEKGANYGIKVLYDRGAKAATDIIFVHGLTGNAYTTWLDDKSGVHWPSQLLKEDVADARILSFGYDADVVRFWNPASNSRLSNHAESLVGDLVRLRERTDTEERKIVFVAHSLGGLVTEQALVHSHSKNSLEPHLAQIERCASAIIFLGTPHCGSDLAAWGVLGTRMAKMLKQANEEIVAVLKPGSEMLRLIQNNFHTILDLRKKEGRDIAITSFFEELPVFAVGEAMTKFSDRDDRGYDRVVGELRRWQRVTQSTSSQQPHVRGVTPAAKDAAASFHGPITGGSVVGAVYGDYNYSYNVSQTGERITKPWTVPRTVSRLYTGRQEIGRELERAFQLQDEQTPKEQRRFVISGLGGTGKSEVCIKFAHDCRKKYQGVFWIDCQDENTARDGFERAGRLCGLAELDTASVKAWLSSTGDSWLLVIDNADNPKFDYATYFPSGEDCSVIVTTRNPDSWKRYATVGHVDLDQLEPSLARNLLFRAAGRELVDADEHEAAGHIVAELGRHTLAILQAGAYISQSCEIVEYLELYRKQQDRLFKHEREQEDSTYRTVHATFEVSVEQLEVLRYAGAEDAGDALDLLDFLAFMHYESQLELILDKATQYAEHLSQREHRANDREDWTLSPFHAAQLPRYSPRAADGAEVRVHLKRVKSGAMPQTKAMELESYLLEGQLLHRQGSLKKAVEMLEHVVSVQEKTLNETHPSRLASQHALARAYRSNGQISEAVQILEHVVSVQEKTLNKTHPSRLASQHALAGAYRSNGQISEAVQILKHVVSVKEKTLDETHPSQLASQHALAIAYESKGQISEAVQILEHVVSVKEKTLDKTHPSRLASQHALAGAYESKGQISEAVQILKHVVSVQEKTLNKTHPSQLASQHALAGAYQSNGQISEAVQILEHVVSVQEKTLNETHPSRLASQHALARAYRSNGQISEAVQILEHVVSVREKTLDETHPDRLASQHALAGAYKSKGQISEAVQILEHVVSVHEKTLNETHPDRLASQHALAGAYESKGQISEAVQILEHVISVKEKTLDETHPSRLASQHALAIAYQSNGQISKAVEMLERVERPP
ncbi:MAG: hypothetical protein Q9162_004553 [Coniocarpon cinnabarinum]